MKENSKDTKKHDSVPEVDGTKITKEDVKERKIDDQLDQSFPASDPPSYSKPGNDDITEEKKKK